ncbi:MAG: DnaJ domain-containing protein [Gammaproteobacteria bacterium]|nr:DnaJ domain-containing protein [Gammaproteobacteria bacterium]
MSLINLDRALLKTIDLLLTEFDEGIKEYDLMTLLDKRYPDLYPKPDLSDQVILFQHHFFLRFTLYTLQQQYAEEGKWQLEITPVKIIKQPFLKSTNSIPMLADPLRDYYLDLSNLNKETELTIQSMLDNFWVALAKYQHQPSALAILGLVGNESATEKKQRYKRLLQLYHPDKGGNAEKFSEIQQAWKQLLT